MIRAEDLAICERRMQLQGPSCGHSSQTCDSGIKGSGFDA